MTELSKNFYENFSSKLLKDYSNGNPRIEAAIQHTLSWISPDAKRILDIGCGIGWSTWEIKRNHKEAFVQGVDLSSKNIEIAQKLFNDSNLAFINLDIFQEELKSDHPFDAIVMLDVIEHIPKEKRDKMFQLLSKALKKDGIVILTFPSLFHQNFLRTQEPGGLQPIDEDVTMEDMSKMARAINGDVLYFKHVTIWHTNDYVHVAVKLNPTFIQHSDFEKVKLPALEPQNIRAQRVTSLLKVRVVQNGIVLPDKEGPTICIVSPSKFAYSETFIRAHIERLPAKVKVLYGGYFPEYTDNDQPLISRKRRYLNKVFNKIFHINSMYFQNQSLRCYLKKENIKAVLAEYGPTGVNLMEVCQTENIPLIVHFHGFDASNKEILEQYDKEYRRMFDIAKAVIAVSHDMEKKLLNLGVQKEKLFYNPCGADIEIFSGALPEEAKPIFISVGRFVDKKAPHLTILAFKKVSEIFPNASLIMIGTGELFEACKQLTKALGIAENVEFLGNLSSNKEVAAKMRMARAFVQHSIQTSYGDSEGTPVSLLEASASGLPVVSTLHGGIKDVVIHGETGFLVDEGDIDTMAKFMLDLAKNPLEAGKLGRRAREHICENFSLEKSISNLWQIIENVIKK